MTVVVLRHINWPQHVPLSHLKVINILKPRVDKFPEFTNLRVAKRIAELHKP